MKKRAGRRPARAVLCAAMALMLLGGCAGQTADEEAGAPAESEAQEDPIRIGLSFDSFVIERWLRDRDVFVSTAQSLGAEVNVQNANGIVEEQCEQIRYLVGKGMDVIAVVAIDGGELREVIAEAQRAGVKIVCYDRLIPHVGADLYISFDNTRVGELMGEALIEALPDGGSVLEILGSSSDNNVAQVREGFERTLEGTDIEIVYTSYCTNWLAELAFDAVNTGLERSGGTADAVMCGNDDLAGQAIRALTEHKMAGTVPVVAQDADLAACQRIIEGTQTMTVYKSVEKEAEMAARYAVALAQGRDITDPDEESPVTAVISDGTQEIPYCALEPVAVTAENLDEVIIDSGFHAREDVYRNTEY